MPKSKPSSVNWYNVYQGRGWIGNDITIRTRTVLHEVLEGDANAGFIFWGGGDIASSLYNQKSKHIATPETVTTRCKFEHYAALRIMAYNKPMVGVCRGAQLLNVICGGSMLQDVNNHKSGMHEIFFKMPGATGTRTLQVNSAHHQMMIIPKDAVLLGWTQNQATEALSEIGKIQVKPMFKEPEIVYYPENRILGIQGHPEWVPNTSFEKLCTSLVKELL